MIPSPGRGSYVTLIDSILSLEEIVDAGQKVDADFAASSVSRATRKLRDPAVAGRMSHSRKLHRITPDQTPFSSATHIDA